MNTHSPADYTNAPENGFIQSRCEFGQWRSYTRASTHVKSTGAQVKIMWKANIKDQLLACAIAAFMWT